MMKPFELLVEAVIRQAAKDYRRVRGYKNSCERYDLERFFLSKWFCNLTNLDGSKILARLKAGD